jgi:hypothetical protein
MTNLLRFIRLWGQVTYSLWSMSQSKKFFILNRYENWDISESRRLKCAKTHNSQNIIDPYCMNVTYWSIDARPIGQPIQAKFSFTDRSELLMISQIKETLQLYFSCQPDRCSPNLATDLSRTRKQRACL